VKWYIAENTHSIRERLIETGEEIVSQEVRERQNIEGVEEHKDFKLKIMMRDAQRFDVMVLGNLDDAVGFSKSAVVPWVGGVKGRVLVGTVTGGSESVWRLKNAMRGCVVGFSQCSIIVTGDRDTAKQIWTMRKRVVFLQNSIDPLIEAVNDVKNYKNFEKSFYE